MHIGLLTIAVVAAGVLVDPTFTEGLGADNRLLLAKMIHHRWVGIEDWCEHAKNTVVPFTLGYKLSYQVVSQGFLIELYVGKDLEDGSPAQKTKFWLEFYREQVWGLPNSPLCPSGLNVSKQAGFTESQSSSMYSNLEYESQNYWISIYSTWLRFDGKQKLASGISPIPEFLIIKNCESWVARQNTEYGVLRLGPRAVFWDYFMQTYKAESTEGDRIPVSWSLNPVNEDHLFDSRVKYFNGSFILNGLRAKGPHHGLRSSYDTYGWANYSMNFMMGRKWGPISAYVCIDPEAATFVSLPYADYQQVWKTIREDICPSSPNYCNYNQANLKNMTAFDIWLNNSASWPYKPHLSLNWSDIFKKDPEGNYQGKGVGFSGNLNSPCPSDRVILGKWFFTKVELTFWLKATEVPEQRVLISLSYVADQNGPPRQEEPVVRSYIGLFWAASTLTALLFAIISVFVFKKLTGNPVTPSYQSSVDDTPEVSTRNSFGGKL